MKKAISLLAALLLLVSLGASAFAVDAVTSVKVQPAPTVSSATLTNPDGSTDAADPSEITITPADEVVDSGFTAAVNDLLDKPLSTVSVDSAAILSALGVSKEDDVTVGGVYNITVTGAVAAALSNGGSIDIVLDLSGTPAGAAIKNGSKAVVIHMTGTSWQKENSTVNGAAQTITVQGITSTSPFAVLIPSGGPTGGTTSPQTSDSTLGLWMLTAVLAAAAAAVCFSLAGKANRKKVN